MPLPRTQLSRLSVKSRIGFNSDARRTRMQSRLGEGVIIDAREKINLNRIQSGRIRKVEDARERIEAKRMPIRRNRLSIGQQYASPVKNLVITTTNSPPEGLFRSAVTGLENWSYIPPPVQPFSRTSLSAIHPMLTRTISNPLASSVPEFIKLSSTPSNFGTNAASVAKVVPCFGLSTGRLRSDPRSGSRDEDMDIDRSSAPPRSSVQSRLDSSKFKVKISNLQSTVTLDDIAELFSDVGDLMTAKISTPGNAEAYYRTKSDCLKAVDAYHNRLLDGSPMKVSFEEESFVDTSVSTGKIHGPLKSASGAILKLPKSSSANKIHPDLSAIHKVLFQPSSSSTAAKMLFKGAGTGQQL